MYRILFLPNSTFQITHDNITSDTHILNNNNSGTPGDPLISNNITTPISSNNNNNNNNTETAGSSTSAGTTTFLQHLLNMCFAVQEKRCGSILQNNATYKQAKQYLTNPSNGDVYIRCYYIFWVVSEDYAILKAIKNMYSSTTSDSPYRVFGKHGAEKFMKTVTFIDEAIKNIRPCAVNERNIKQIVQQFINTLTLHYMFRTGSAVE